MPSKKKKQIEIIDGVEREVEVMMPFKEMQAVMDEYFETTEIVGGTLTLADTNYLAEEEDADGNPPQPPSNLKTMKKPKGQRK